MATQIMIILFKSGVGST